MAKGIEFAEKLNQISLIGSSRKHREKLVLLVALFKAVSMHPEVAYRLPCGSKVEFNGISLKWQCIDNGEYRHE